VRAAATTRTWHATLDRARDTLAPGCRLLARRASDTDWDFTYVEVPDLIHVYPLLPLIPEARAAFDRTLEFLR
jgi:monoterpene epsilon-lactone hydrolase